MKAKAAIFRKIGEPITIEAVDVADPGPEEVRIRTAACGVCHSDVHFVKGNIPGPTPTIPGHEPAGVVESVGERVSMVKRGDHVIACTSLFCTACPQCLQGYPHLCSNRRACRRGPNDPPRLSLGGKLIHQFADLSGFAELMLVHERAVVKIDDDIPLDRAALVGCAVTTGVGAALNTAKVHPGSSVAVIGAGGVGISIIQGARIAGARQIIAVDLLDSKLEKARGFGATHTVNASSGDTVREIKKLSDGGVDYAFDAVGSARLVEQCLYSLAPRGTAVVVGAIPPDQRLDLIPGHFFVEKRLIGCMMGSNRFHIDAPRYLELYRQGRLDLDGMVTRRAPLEQVEDAFRAMEAGEVIRTVLTFD